MVFVNCEQQRVSGSAGQAIAVVKRAQVINIISYIELSVISIETKPTFVVLNANYFYFRVVL